MQNHLLIINVDQRLQYYDVADSSQKYTVCLDGKQQRKCVSVTQTDVSHIALHFSG